jgi:isopentenyl phosphate kinase
MADKVQQSLTLARTISGLEVLVFSGEMPGRVQEVLLGAKVGTVIRGE